MAPARLFLRNCVYLLAGFAAPACAQSGPPEHWTLHEALDLPEELSVSGTARARYETIANEFRPGVNQDADAFLLRTNIAAQYDAGALRIGAELIDARVYGASPNGSIDTGEVNAIELSQAYIGVDLHDALTPGSKSTLDVGRFTMDLGSRRLVSRNGFRNTINAFTGIKMTYAATDGMSAAAYWVMPHIRLPADPESIAANDVEIDRATTDLVLFGGFLRLPSVGSGDTMDLYAYALEENDSPAFPTRNRHLYTPGLRLFRNPAPHRLDWEMEGIYQFGHTRLGLDRAAQKADVSAYFLHAELGYQFAGDWRTRLSLEYDRASGDEPGGAYSRFDTLYGSRRLDFGPSNLYGALSRNNISSPGLRIEVAPGARWDGFAAYRAAWLASRTDSFAGTGLRDPSGSSGSFAAHQIEGRVRYWLIPEAVRLESGAAFLLRGRFMKQAPNANRSGDTLYGYFDLTWSF